MNTPTIEYNYHLMILYLRSFYFALALALGCASAVHASILYSTCESAFRDADHQIALVAGGRMNGGHRIGSKGDQGGAYRAIVLTNGMKQNAAETRINDYYVDLGSFDTTTRQAHALEAAQRASHSGLSPRFYGYIDVKLKHGEIVRYLYIEEFGDGQTAVSDNLGELRGSWEITPRIRNWLLQHKGQSEGQKLVDLMVTRYRRIVEIHPDPHDDNILVGLFVMPDGSHYIRVEAIDWTHWMSYPLSNKTLPLLRETSEKFLPIVVGPI